MMDRVRCSLAGGWSARSAADGVTGSERRREVGMRVRVVVMEGVEDLEELGGHA